MSKVLRTWLFFFAVCGLLVAGWFFSSTNIFAININQYSDTITNSSPLAQSNHTFSFVLGRTIAPGSYFDITFPPGFELMSTSTFAAERNVELSVNGILRNSDDVLSATNDLVEIFPGEPGSVRYTLNTTTGIAQGSSLSLKVGNHTSKSLIYSIDYSTSTGTTTTDADIKPVINASSTGTHKVQMQVYDGSVVADAGFSIAIVEQVGVSGDSTEEIPPERFNPAPTSTISGTSLSVEIFIETNEFAICRFATTAGVNYSAMTNTFDNTGLIYHTEVVSVLPNNTYTYYIRCIDDEGNFNIDDFVLQFSVNERPAGTANEEGDVDGDGTGSGNDGTGNGGGSGGTSGESDGVAPATGGSTGGGGSGGGGGGGSGGGGGGTAGGGFESTDGPYRSGDGRVIVSGFTAPRSEVVILVDGKEALRGRSDNSGSYSVTVDQIARGVYTFGVYSIDTAKNKSSTFSTSFTVIGARTSSLTNINIAPTIKVNPDPVDPGQTLTFSGFALPNATISLENEKEKSNASRTELTATADSNGAWSTTLSTNNFSVGTYRVRAKAEQAGGLTTNFSSFTLYGVGEKAVGTINADLNRDGKINLVDFSILLFWWNTDGGDSDPSADINSDSKVNLVDFSILLFNWTG